jgi:hypothetical protein
VLALNWGIWVVSKEEAERLWSIFPLKQEEQKIIAFAAIPLNYSFSHKLPVFPGSEIRCSGWGTFFEGCLSRCFPIIKTPRRSHESLFAILRTIPYRQTGEEASDDLAQRCGL